MNYHLFNPNNKACIDNDRLIKIIHSVKFYKGSTVVVEPSFNGDNNTLVCICSCGNIFKANKQDFIKKRFLECPLCKKNKIIHNKWVAL